MDWTTCYDDQFAYNLNSLFKLKWDDIFTIEFYFAKDLHIPPCFVEIMPFWKIIGILKKYQDWIKERNEQNKKDNDAQTARVESMKSSMPNMNNMKMPSAPQMPSMPSMPSFPK